MQAEEKSAAVPSASNGDVVEQLFIVVDDRVPELAAIARAFDSADWPACSPLGASANPTVERIALGDPAVTGRVRDTLATVGDARLLVIYASPVIQLAGELDKGGHDLSLRRWCNEVGRILEIFRRHRRQVLLVEGHAALANGAAFIHQLRSRLGVELRAPDLQTRGPSPSPGGIAHLIVEKAIAADPDAGRLAVELHASSLPLPPPVGPELDMLLEEWRGISRISADELKRLEEESALRLEQLHRVQEELEPYLIAGKDPSAIRAMEAELTQMRRLEEENARLVEQLHRAQAELEPYLLMKKDPPAIRAMEAELTRMRRLEEENALLLEQLHKAQEELEPYLLVGKEPSAIRALEAELTRTRRQLSTAESQLAGKIKQVEQIYASKSWKVSAPLRKGLDLLGGGQ